MTIKGPQEYFNTHKRIEISKEQEEEYFNYLMDSIKSLNVIELKNDSDLEYDEIGRNIGELIFNFMFWHVHDSFYWSRCRRMFDYSYQNMKKLGLI